MASQWMRIAIAALMAALTVNAQNSTVGQGTITVQNGKFVDAGCHEFQFSGGNV